MKTKHIETLIGLTGFAIALTLFGGCATVNREAHTQHEDRTVRGMTDSLASPANNYPSN